MMFILGFLCGMIAEFVILTLLAVKVKETKESEVIKNVTNRFD